MSYIGRDIRTGAFRQLDDISSGFDGSDTTHTMQVNSTNVSVGDVNQILLSLGGVIQKPGTDFTVSGSTLTFTTAPAANTNFFAILLGSDNGGTVTPTDLSVTTAKIAADNVTPPKTNFFNTDPGNAADLGMLHIKSADTSGSVSTNADELVIEGTRSGMTFLAANDNFSYINFGDDGAADRGTIRYGHSADSFSFQTAATEAMVIDSTGAVTKPLQPAFSANPSGVQSNIGDNTIIAFATEIFDIGANFASNTFTAPVTGKYLLSANVRIDNLDLDGAYHALTINTSNRAYYALHGSAHWDADANYYFFSISILADMDANDTAYLLYNENSSQTDQADVSTSSYFTGFLAC
jgi:hypothetical protein